MSIKKELEQEFRILYLPNIIQYEKRTNNGHKNLELRTRLWKKFVALQVQCGFVKPEKIVGWALPEFCQPRKKSCK